MAVLLEVESKKVHKFITAKQFEKLPKSQQWRRNNGLADGIQLHEVAIKLPH